MKEGAGGNIPLQADPNYLQHIPFPETQYEVIFIFFGILYGFPNQIGPLPGCSLYSPSSSSLMPAGRVPRGSASEIRQDYLIF